MRFEFDFYATFEYTNRFPAKMSIQLFEKFLKFL